MVNYEYPTQQLRLYSEARSQRPSYLPPPLAVGAGLGRWGRMEWKYVQVFLFHSMQDTDLESSSSFGGHTAQDANVCRRWRVDAEISRTNQGKSVLM